jgi:hypothetical protein
MYLKTFYFIAVFILNAAVGLHAQSQTRKGFSDFFTDKNLRIDYELVGNYCTEQFVLKDLKIEGIWAGPRIFPDTTATDLGNYRLLVYDSVSNQLIYKYGFCNLFQEWQTTNEAKINFQAYYQVNLVPFPLETIKVRFEKLNNDNPGFTLITEFYINPDNKFIRRESGFNYIYTLIHGDDHKVEDKVDIAFLAEGYTNEEMAKFRSDVKQVWEYMSSIPPYNKYQDNFNIYAVECPSIESGTDIPVKQIYKNTILNTSFSTFDTPRYLTTSDIKSIYNSASVVPHDFIIILINSKEYGGGGFYNFYAASTIDHKFSLKVIVHEFGHCLGGLADEYYSSSVAYDSFYSLKKEPWEPNITTLIDFQSKWKNLLDSTIVIPTPRTPEFADKLGVFEGGGYSAKGIYSPKQDCVMKSNNLKHFCPVCEKAIEKVILFYCNSGNR